MRFFGLKTCDTCRKALAALRAAGHAPQVIDVRADGLPPADLAMILSTFGDRAVNRASTTWRNLSAEARSADSATLLATHPTLMKRPVIAFQGIWYLGWGKDVQAALLK